MKCPYCGAASSKPCLAKAHGMPNVPLPEGFVHIQRELGDA